VLDEDTRRVERLLLGLRTVEGVARAEVEPVDEGAARALSAAGLLRDDGRRLALTPAGLALAGGVTERLLPD
jgi:coproporphyrinogen III oxidase-like Fe-S oxidoreductase